MTTSMAETAGKFLHACETGQGWTTCNAYCHSGATFSAQAYALADIATLADYCEWMKGLLTPIPDGQYHIRSFALDQERGHAVVYAVFTGTNTAGGGPVSPTGRAVAAEYVYVMEFNGERIGHMTKIWNDTHSLKQLGWA